MEGDRGPFAPNYPGYPMHEIVGEVLASRDPQVPAGARVVGWASEGNAVAEYVITRGDMVVELEADDDPAQTIVIQPLACVIYAANQLTAVEGARIAVIGQGSIGLLFNHVLKHRGAAWVTAVDVIDRSALAPRFGADQVVHSTSHRWARQVEPSARPDIIVEAVGHQTGTLSDAISAVGQCGQIYYFGIPELVPYPLDLWAFLRKNLTLRSGATLYRRNSLIEGRAYLRRFPDLASLLVSHRYPVREVGEAFEMAGRPDAERAKVIVEFP
jgi:L-iditol 2-dehydrogenase